MVMAEHLPLLPLSAAGLGIVGFFTIPSILTIVRQIRKGAPKDNFYQDRDGKATPESIAAFSNRVPKALILLFASLGLGTSISISVLTALDPARDGLLLENWMVTASWVRSQIRRKLRLTRAGSHTLPSPFDKFNPWAGESSQCWSVDVRVINRDLGSGRYPSLRCWRSLDQKKRHLSDSAHRQHCIRHTHIVSERLHPKTPCRLLPRPACRRAMDLVHAESLHVVVDAFPH